MRLAWGRKRPIPMFLLSPRKTVRKGSCTLSGYFGHLLLCSALPVNLLACLPPCSPAAFGHAAESAAAGAKLNKNKKGGSDDSSSSGNEKLRRRGLVLACLDVLGPTTSCLSLIRQGRGQAGVKFSCFCFYFLCDLPVADEKDS